MPIHDLGYRVWQGRRSPDFCRFWVIAESGFRLAWNVRWLRRALLVAWLPAVWMGALFFGYEQSLQVAGIAAHAGDSEVGPDTRVGPRLRVNSNARKTNRQRRISPFDDPRVRQTALGGLARNLPDGERLIEKYLEDPAGSRHFVWTWLLHTFFRYPQGTLMVLVIGLVAPPLIAHDVRSRAFLLYFSRPLTRWEYLLGKAATVWCFLGLITTLPALALYVMGVLMSPALSVILDTWDLPLRILGASMVLMLPTTILALCFSSLTSETRYAGFAWFVVWAFGWVTYAILQAADPNASWTLVSLFHMLGEVQNWVFGLVDATRTVVLSASVLVGITLVSLAVLMWRVSAPIRV
jgi:ABC-type transport system involved in multi-copper enzyme maturation permease subunit